MGLEVNVTGKLSLHTSEVLDHSPVPLLSPPTKKKKVVKAHDNETAPRILETNVAQT